MSVAAYPAYLDSGVEWLGPIPEGWSVKPLWAMTTCNDDVLSDSTPSDYMIDYIEISDVDAVAGVRGRSELEFSAAPSRARRRVRDGDVIVSTVRTYLRAIAALESPSANTVVSTGFAVMRPRAVHAGYLAHLFRAEFLVNQIIARSVGVSYPAINASEISHLNVPVPSPDEQTAIAAFLDHETAKIDALVAEQERLIALLKEKRQAVISHAVTKGLDPNAPMKDSGVQWLGQVPAHWIPTMLGRVCIKVADGPHYSPEYTEAGILFISARNIRVDGWSLDDAKYISDEDYMEFCRRVVPEVGDVLYTKGGTTGIARVVDILEPFQVWVHVAVIKINKKSAMPYFIAYALNSTGCYEQSQLHTRGATNQDLGLNRMTKIWLALPPLNEQLEIVAYLDGQIAKLDSLVNEAIRVVDILKERRAALISAAVTGKIDVRGFVRPEQQDA